jgi:hypothetical protein
MANLSTNKVRVTKAYGASADVGLIEPHVNMRVRVGIADRWIVSMNADHSLLNLAQSSGGAVVQQAYPHQCEINYAQATGGFGFPAATSVVFGHASDNPAGLHATTDGFVVEGGQGPHSYTYSLK